MKITGARDHMIVEFDHRCVKIYGELTTTPAFYADLKSIGYWEPPFERELISDVEKDEIVRRVLEQTENETLKIYFE